MSERVWADVPGWPGYRVSDDGVVESCKNTRGALTNEWSPKSLVEIGGYLRVELSHRSRVFQSQVSALVLTCHGPARPPGPSMALHCNGNRLDNRIENLRWGFADDNADDRDRHRTTATGESHGNAKLTWEKVHELRRKRGEGVSMLALSSEYGISRSHASKIVRGLMWRADNDIAK